MSENDPGYIDVLGFSWDSYSGYISPWKKILFGGFWFLLCSFPSLYFLSYSIKVHNIIKVESILRQIFGYSIYSILILCLICSCYLGLIIFNEGVKDILNQWFYKELERIR